MKRLKRGDHIIFRRTEISRRPSLHAKRIRAAARGDDYAYLVEEPCTVRSVFPDGTVDAMGTEGRAFSLTISDPRLRKAGMLDHLFRRQRFPELAEA